MAKTEQVRHALYTAFSPDTGADDSELTDNDLLVRYRMKC